MISFITDYYLEYADKLYCDASIIIVIRQTQVGLHKLNVPTCIISFFIISILSFYCVHIILSTITVATVTMFPFRSDIPSVWILQNIVQMQRKLWLFVRQIFQQILLTGSCNDVSFLMAVFFINNVYNIVHVFICIDHVESCISKGEWCRL